MELASTNFILDLARHEQQRPVYISVKDTLIAVPTILFIIAGRRNRFAQVFGRYSLPSHRDRSPLR